jgi:hypothetical protein
MTLKGKARTRYMRDYMRRWRAGQQPKPKPSTPTGQIKVTHAPRQEFGEIGKLRAEIGRLRSDILKLKMALQEEPNVARLRKKVVDQQVEMTSMRSVMKGIAKERDKLQVHVKAYRQPKHQEAHRLLTGPNYRILIKALHSDRSKHCTAAELATAERVATALRPLFIEAD